MEDLSPLVSRGSWPLVAGPSTLYPPVATSWQSSWHIDKASQSNNESRGLSTDASMAVAHFTKTRLDLPMPRTAEDT